MEGQGVILENLVYADFVSESMLSRVKSLELERQVGKNMTNYQIGDFLIRLKNASRAGIKEVEVLKTKIILQVAETLKREGFLDSVEVVGTRVKVRLSVFQKTMVLSDVKIVSRPGLRIYMSVEDLESYKKPDVLILTTPKGVVSGDEARKMRVGGEVIAKVI